MGRCYFLDKDIVIDRERNNIYQVLTNYNTKGLGYIFAMLKYERGEGDLWKGYRRVLKSYGVHNLVKLKQKFEYQPCLDANFPIVYMSQIGTHLKPEEGFKKVLEGKIDNDFAEVILSLANEIGSSSIGVGGSILTGIYHDQSDIDLIVYGYRSLEIYFSLPELSIDTDWISETSINYGIPVEETKYLYDPKRRGFFMGKKVSINFVDNKLVNLCENLCVQKEKAELDVSVEKEQMEALFYPSRVRCDGSYKGRKVEEIISYEGIFSSLLFKGGRLNVSGVLMECEDGNKVIIGDRNFRGNIRRIM